MSRVLYPFPHQHQTNDRMSYFGKRLPYIIVNYGYMHVPCASNSELRPSMIPHRLTHEIKAE